MWEYVKGSEADFEGAPEWCTHVSVSPVNKAKAWEVSSQTINGNKYQWCESSKPRVYENCDVQNLNIIAERRKVDNLQSRVNDANLGDALKEMFDTVNRPVHYNQSGIECIDAIAASMTPAEFQAYLKGNVQKYLWRYQHKNGVEDCRKAQWYLDRLVKELSK